MKKLRFLLALLIVFSMAGGAWAASDLFNVQLRDEATIDTINITSDGRFGGYRDKIEIITGNRTLTTEDSNTVFFVDNGAAQTTFTLTTARNGLRFTFIALDGDKGTGVAEIILNPTASDTFFGCVNSDAISTFDKGDDLDSPGITGDAVTIIGTRTGQRWVCKDRVGTWVDGN